VRIVLIVLRFSQDIQLIDKKLPPAVQTIVTRQYSSSSSKLQDNNTFRILQTSHADCSSFYRPKMAGNYPAGLYGFSLYRPEVLSPDVKATPVFRAGVPGKCLLELFRICR
jgi:hypothetical protein